MTAEDVPDEPLSDAELHDQAVRLLLAMLRSASTDDIAPRDWWRRGQAALEAGAGMATSLPQMVSKMADKLEVPAPTKATAREISSVSSAIREHDQWADFRRICERDAFMICSDAQMVREMERDEWEEQDADDVEFADPFGLASEMDLEQED